MWAAGRWLLARPSSVRKGISFTVPLGQFHSKSRCQPIAVGKARSISMRTNSAVYHFQSRVQNQSKSLYCPSSLIFDQHAQLNLHCKRYSRRRSSCKKNWSCGLRKWRPRAVLFSEYWRSLKLRLNLERKYHLQQRKHHLLCGLHA